MRPGSGSTNGLAVGSDRRSGGSRTSQQLESARMTIEAARIDRPAEDPVSNVLKWVLLVVAVASFAILGWTTKLTYEAAPPFPDRFVTPTAPSSCQPPICKPARRAFKKPT